MTQTFRSPEACREFISNELKLGNADPATAEILINCLADAFDESEETKNDKGFDVIIGKWVIRDEQLKLFPTVKDSVLALAAVGYVLQDITLAGGTGLIFAGLSLIRNVHKYGVEVNPTQASIIKIMASQGKALSNQQIYNFLEPNLPAEWVGAFDQDSVDMNLKALEDYPSRAGVEKLVIKRGDDTWVLNGL